MGNPKNWNSFESKTTQKCHLSILSNTWYAWSCENLPKYKLKFPLGSNIDTNKLDGTEPNQEIEKKFRKNYSSQPFFEKPPIQVKT